MPKATRDNRRATEKQPAVASGSRYDWTALRTQFVTGSDSISEFAERHGINRTTVAKRCSEEGWAAEREAHRKTVANKAQSELAKKQARSEAEIDGEAHEIALLILQKAKGMAEAVDMPTDLKSVAQSVEAAYRLARVTAHLTPEPMANPASSDADGVIRIKRRGPDGEVVEVTVDGSTRHRSGSDGLPSDAHAVDVPAGPNEPAEGDDRRAG